MSEFEEPLTKIRKRIQRSRRHGDLTVGSAVGYRRGILIGASAGAARRAARAYRSRTRCCSRTFLLSPAPGEHPSGRGQLIDEVLLAPSA